MSHSNRRHQSRVNKLSHRIRTYTVTIDRFHSLLDVIVAHSTANRLLILSPLVRCRVPLTIKLNDRVLIGCTRVENLGYEITRKSRERRAIETGLFVTFGSQFGELIEDSCPRDTTAEFLWNSIDQYLSFTRKISVLHAFYIVYITFLQYTIFKWLFIPHMLSEERSSVSVLGSRMIIADETPLYRFTPLLLQLSYS